MWYNKDGEPVDIEWELDVISSENMNDFDPDQLIDELYPRVNLFGVNYYPSDIIKNMDPTVYHELREERRQYWIEDVLDEIRRRVSDGDSLSAFISYREGEDYTWKEEDAD